jgi:hypothetical protein
MREFRRAYDRDMALMSWDRWIDRFLDEPVDFGASPRPMRYSVHVERRACLQDRRTRELPWLGRESRRSAQASRRR